MAIKAMLTLIKFSKRQIDVLRREMIAFEEERRQLEEAAVRLAAEHMREMELAAREPQIGSYFGAYSKRVKERQENMSREKLRLTAEIDAKANAILEAFGEQKKYEIARDAALKRAAAKAQRQEQQRFDEIAIQQYINREDSPL